MKNRKNILITGGAGFIGSHTVRLFVKKYPEYNIYNLDKLTYAGNPENLTDIEKYTNYNFIKADICDSYFIDELFKELNFKGVIHLAAESHVDRSIANPADFIDTNIGGTLNLLNAAKKHWTGNYDKHVFYQISTDEVYGSLSDTGFFTEQSSYDPRSPYSASKAAADHLVRAYFHTFKLNTVISNCSNNYGPNQFPEKLIPLVINNILKQKPLPVYGNGLNVRDWLYVEDHADAIDTVFHKSAPGQTYNIGGNNERTNIEIVKTICRIMDSKLGNKAGFSEKLITYVSDRPGHDHRYAIDSSKIQKELNWKPRHTFASGIEKTVDWYLQNTAWLNNVISGEYENYYNRQYKQ